MVLSAKRQFGWRPDRPDRRDYRYRAPRAVLAKLPRSVDLRKTCPAVRDQGRLGSCTGFAVTAAFAFATRKQGREFKPSPLFAYYAARATEGLESVDSGSEVRTVIKCIADVGVCGETRWPYVVRKFAVQPPHAAYTEALDHQSLRYERIEELKQIKARLAEGFPVAFGFGVYESFESIGKSGIMPMPARDEAMIGGHAVLAVGYSDKARRLTVMNSWGTKWGAKGFFYMPYAFAESTDFADDWWTVSRVEVAA